MIKKIYVLKPCFTRHFGLTNEKEYNGVDYNL